MHESARTLTLVYRVGMIDDATRWADALNGFAESERARGVSQATTARRLKALRRFSREFAGSPWHVTPERAQFWLGRANEQELSAAQHATRRDSLRAFYRWAKSAGWVSSNPADYDQYAKLRLEVPGSWQTQLTAYERYLRAKGVAATSVRSYLEQLRTFARAHRSVEPFQVSTDDLYEWMAGQTWARETRRARKAMLVGFYSWAVDTDRTEHNPAARLPTVRAGDVHARPVTDTEYADALAAASPRWVLALRLAAELGLRRGEVAQVHTADVVTRDDGAWLTVHGKGGKVRKVPLPNQLANTITSSTPGYVFPGAIVECQRAAIEGHLSARYLGRQITALLPPGVTMHALRHRFATRVYDVNRDVFTVQRLLGHASPATTQRYVQVSDAAMRALVEAAS